MSLEQDLAICEAATEGPWFVANWTDDAGHYFVEDGRQEGLYPIRCEGNEARYIAHFNPAYVTRLITRVQELESALQKVLDDTEIGVVPRSHLDRIEELLK